MAGRSSAQIFWRGVRGSGRSGLPALLGLGLVGLPAAAAPACTLDLPSYVPQEIAFPKGASYVTSDGRIRVVGYNDMLEILTALDDIFIEKHPGFAFDLILKGTKTAPAALARRESAFAPMGAEFSPAQIEEYRNIAGTAPSMVLFKIAHDSLNPHARSSPVAIYVNAQNPLDKLSIDEAKQVFTIGSAPVTTTWGGVGLTGAWADKTIHVIGLSDETAIGPFLRHHKFEGRPFAPGYVGLAQSTEVIAAVGEDPQAIGFANLSLATPEVKALPLSDHVGGPAFAGTADDVQTGKYPLDRHLLIYAPKGEAGHIDPLVREYLRLVFSCEGQSAIAAQPLAYLPLNRDEITEELAKLK